MQGLQGQISSLESRHNLRHSGEGRDWAEVNGEPSGRTPGIGESRSRTRKSYFTSCVVRDASNSTSAVHIEFIGAGFPRHVV